MTTVTLQKPAAGKMMKNCDNCGKQFKSRMADKGRYTRFCSKHCELAWRQRQTQIKAEALKPTLLHLLWDERKTYNEMAEILGCSSPTIQRLLLRSGIRSEGQLLNNSNRKGRRLCGRSMKGRPHSPEHNRKVWETVKNNPCHGFWKSSGRFKRNPQAASEAAQISNAKRWSDPETKAKVLKNVMKAVNAKPNLTELRLQSMLDQHFPREWKFVGNGEVIIGGKLPDFININGKKQIIELFGIFWHNLFDTAVRTNHFRQYGFKTLIIWEDELENEAKLVKKVKAFTRRKEYAHH